VLAPGVLLRGLPLQLRAMAASSSSSSGGGGGSNAIGGSLGALVSEVAALTAAAGDRGALLVAQELPAAVAAIVATSCAAVPDGLCSWAVAAADWLERAAADDHGSGSSDTDAPLLQRLQALAAWEAGPEYAELWASGAPLVLQGPSGSSSHQHTA
jgi:hypothetical protein